MCICYYSLFYSNGTFEQQLLSNAKLSGVILQLLEKTLVHVPGLENIVICWPFHHPLLYTNIVIYYYHRIINGVILLKTVKIRDVFQIKYHINCPGILRFTNCNQFGVHFHFIKSNKVSPPPVKTFFVQLLVEWIDSPTVCPCDARRRNGGASYNLIPHLFFP